MAEKLIVALDSQKLDAIQSCLYLFNMKFNKHIKSIHTPEFIERGSLIHDMLAPYYRLKKYRGRWHQNGKTHADIVNSCITIGRHAGNKMELDVSEIERTIDVFQEYTDLWENDNWNNIIGVETVGAKLLYESDDLDILYEVKIDLTLDLNGQITPVDHKSASSRRDANEMSNQFKGYCWFLGVNTLIQNDIGFQKTVKPHDKFRRQQVSFSDALIQEWVDNSVWWVKHAIQAMNDSCYPRNFTSCDKYSGCMFKDNVCAKDPEVREYKLRELYKIEEWDVGAKHL